MAALVLGAICQAGDKTPWLAAILADRFRVPAVVIGATAVALAGRLRAAGFRQRDRRGIGHGRADR